MSTRHVFAYADVAVRCDWRLAGLRDLQLPEQRLPDLVVDRVRAAPDIGDAAWSFLWRPPNGVPTIFRHAADGAYWVRFEGLASFVITTLEVSVAASPTTNDETIRHLLLDQVLPRVLAHRGHTVLHASAVEIDGRAIAFLGDTGAGKSTIAAAFHRAAHPLLTDDGLVVRPEDTTLLAVPTYPSLRLWPDAVDVLYDAPPEAAPMADYTSKLRLPVDDREGPSRTAWPLAAMYVLRPSSEAGAINTSRLPARDACITIIRNAFQLDPSDRIRATHLLAAAADVAEWVPVFLLSYPRDFSVLPEVRAAVLQRQPEWAAVPAEAKGG